MNTEKTAFQKSMEHNERMEEVVQAKFANTYEWEQAGIGDLEECCQDLLEVAELSGDEED